jgi:hypothetical protein
MGKLERLQKEIDKIDRSINKIVILSSVGILARSRNGVE